jgi:hypothetical protein
MPDAAAWPSGLPIRMPAIQLRDCIVPIAMIAI